MSKRQHHWKTHAKYLFLYFLFAFGYTFLLIRFNEIRGNFFSDEWLIFLIPPIFFYAYFFSRWVYMSAMVITIFFSIYGIVCLTDKAIYSAFLTTILYAFMVIITCEFIHSIKKSRRRMVQIMDELCETNTKLSNEIKEREKVERQRDRLITAVEQSAEAMVVCDQNAAIQYVNSAFEDITGYSPDEVLGKNPKILKSGVQDEEFYRKMWETLQQGEPWKGRLVNRRKDGTLYNEEDTITPVKDQEGRIIHYVAVKRDITMESMLETQIRQTQKMEAIGQLARGIAHDFNNLLTSICGNLDLLERRIKDPGLQKFIANADEASQRAAHLVNELLTFSRMSRIHPQPNDLNRFIKQTYPLLRTTLNRSIAIKVSTEEGLPLVLFDERSLQTLIMNLIMNSRDALMELDWKEEPFGNSNRIHEKRIQLSTSTQTLNMEINTMTSKRLSGSYAMLCISDTGVGMDAETREHLFEPFFTTKEVGKGSGLGLSSVYGIVDQHNGYIQIESEPEKGTTCKIYLPFAGKIGTTSPS